MQEPSPLLDETVGFVEVLVLVKIDIVRSESIILSSSVIMTESRNLSSESDDELSSTRTIFLFLFELCSSSFVHLRLLLDTATEPEGLLFFSNRAAV